MTQPLLQDWKELQPLTYVIVVMFSLVDLREYVSRTKRGVEKLLHAMVKTKNLYNNCLYFSYSHNLPTSC